LHANVEWDDKRTEIIIGVLLRTGVLIAAVVVIFGAIVFLIRHGSSHANYSVFNGAPEELRSPHAILKGALDLSGRATIQFGLLLLIATPVARVVFSAVAFLLEKDYLYVAITLIVLATLLFSLFGAIG